MSEPREDEDRNEDEDNGPNERDHVWLLARERGEEIGHVPAGERAPYEKLGAMLGSGVAPSPGFRRRVLDAIDAEETKPAVPAIAEAAGTAGATAAAGATETAGATAAAGMAAAGPSAAAGVTAEVVAASAADSLRHSVERELEQRRARRKQQQRRGWIVAGALAAAAATALWLQKAPDPSHGGPGDELTAQLGSGKRIALMTTVRHDDRVVRGDLDEATVGDMLYVRAAAVGPAELRVYGGSGGRLLVRCSEVEPGDCKIEREGEVRQLTLNLRLEVPGTVKAVVFVGANVPASTGAFDPDLEAAAGARVEYEVRKPVTQVH